MLNFIIMWIVSLIGIRVYLHVKKIEISGINNDVISLVLSLIIVTFLNFMHWIVGSLANFIIR